MLRWHDYEKEHPEPGEEVLCYYYSIGNINGGVYRMRKANKFGRILAGNITPWYWTRDFNVPKRQES